MFVRELDHGLDRELAWVVRDRFEAQAVDDVLGQPCSFWPGWNVVDSSSACVNVMLVTAKLLNCAAFAVVTVNLVNGWFPKIGDN
jgi:hypothetical protein